MVDKNLTPKEVDELAGRRYNKDRKWSIWLALSMFIVGAVLILASLILAGSYSSAGNTYLWGNHTILVDSGIVTVDGQAVQWISEIDYNFGSREIAMIGIGGFLLLALLIWAIIYSELKSSFKEKILSEWFKEDDKSR
jgi:hypothetical protein